jgi:hypothetical protein
MANDTQRREMEHGFLFLLGQLSVHILVSSAFTDVIFMILLSSIHSMNFLKERDELGL